MSHLIKAETRFKDLELLKEKVQEAGCFWIGARDSVRVFNSQIKGTAFHVPNMVYPVVVNDDGEMIYETEEATSIPTGPVRTLMTIMRDYVLDNIQKGPNDVVRSREDDMGTVHVDLRNGDKMLKFHVALGGTIKAEAEGYPDNTCVDDLKKAISGVPVAANVKESERVENTV